MNVIYGPPAECNTPGQAECKGQAECNTLLHSACTRELMRTVTGKGIDEPVAGKYTLAYLLIIVIA